uniref:HtrA serine peptidase 3a n=1 Tax=Oreochromis niloticus TaxID=8128 RepID=I3J6D1_ORENI
MQLFIFVAAFLFAHEIIEAVRSDKCASRCDVSSCPSPSCPGGYVPDRCNCCLVCSPREGDPCGRKDDLPCGDGLECKLFAAGKRRGSKGACRCKMDHEVWERRENKTCRLHYIQCRPSKLSLGDVIFQEIPRYKFNFIADVVEKIAPAVVHIELFLRHPLLGRHMRLSSGSGFIVSHSGVIVTNAHVVTTAALVTGRPQLRVQLHDGDAYEAVVKDIDRKADIATIEVNPQKLRVLSLGSSADLRPGEFVVAIGSPFALQNTVTTGIVSTAQRDGKELGIKDSDMDYIQTDAIINYGNSGGPLVNLDGEVIGINTLKVTAGISFAIPADRISRFLSESQIKHKKDGDFFFKRYFLGIWMVTITKALVEELRLHNPDFPDISSGVLVRQVIPNTPAEKGGIREGDVIVKLNAKPVRTTEDIHEVLQSDQPLLLEIRRGNDDLLFNIHPHPHIIN